MIDLLGSREPSDSDRCADCFGHDGAEDLADVHLLCGVVDRGDDRQHRRQSEHEAEPRREARDDGLSVVTQRCPDPLQHHQAIGERAHDDGDDPPVERVPRQTRDHPRRELRRPLLHDQQRHRERDAGERDRRRRHRRQHRTGAVNGRLTHPRPDIDTHRKTCTDEGHHHCDSRQHEEVRPDRVCDTPQAIHAEHCTAGWTPAPPSTSRGALLEQQPTR